MTLISGDFVDLIGAYSMSVIRAMVTCCIPMNEFGKIYAVLTAFENLIPIGVSQVYAELWMVPKLVLNFKCFQVKTREVLFTLLNRK